MFNLCFYYFINLLFILHRKTQKSIDEGHFHVSLECTLQASQWDLGWWQVKVHIQKKNTLQGDTPEWNQPKNAAGGPQGGPHIYRRVKNKSHKQIHMTGYISFFSRGKHANGLQHAYALDFSVVSEIFFQMRDVKNEKFELKVTCLPIDVLALCCCK